MRIYVAGSFSNRQNILSIGNVLREHGFDTYVFCDPMSMTGKLSEELRLLYDLQSFTAKSVYETKILANIGLENLYELVHWMHLSWCYHLDGRPIWKPAG